MIDAEKTMIAKAACDCIESMGPLFYATTDGEDDPDVLVCPLPLRPEEEPDGYIFNRKFDFDLTFFLEKLGEITNRTLDLNDVIISYTNESLSISLLSEDDGEGEHRLSSEALWIEIIREPPEYVEPGGTLMRDGSIVFDAPSSLKD
jgi:hypothetical protein